MSIFIVFGGALAIEGVVESIIRIKNQVQNQIEIATKRAECKRRRSKSQRRWA